MRRSNRPGMYYGGLGSPSGLEGDGPSVLRGQACIDSIELEGTIPLYKLHGSLNWGLEAGALRLLPRPPASIPPRWECPDCSSCCGEGVPGFWTSGAELDRLSRLPPLGWCVATRYRHYDVAITQLIADAGTEGTLTRIVLMDPYATDLASRWQAVAPNAKLHLLPGLPEALGSLLELVG